MHHLSGRTLDLLPQPTHTQQPRQALRSICIWGAAKVKAVCAGKRLLTTAAQAQSPQLPVCCARISAWEVWVPAEAFRQQCEEPMPGTEKDPNEIHRAGKGTLSPQQTG